MMVKPWQIASFVLIFVFIIQLLLSHKLLSTLHAYLYDDLFIQFNDYIEETSSFINPNAAEDYRRRLSQDPAHAHALPNPAILLFCYNRPDYLNQTLDSLFHLHGLDKFHVIISQDGTDQPTADVIRQAGRRTTFSVGKNNNVKSFQHWQHPRTIPSYVSSSSDQQQQQQQPGHAWLAQHYKWALSRLFNTNTKNKDEKSYSHVIIIEDDMLFSPDFLSYFQTTAPLLDTDPTLWCISSWNDNAFSDANHQWSDTNLFRTTYFPGLGWMMKRDLWVNELASTWPDHHWDHFMRYETTSKGRGCIVPEVNRNKNIGEEGSNMDKYSFKRLIAKMNWKQNDDGGDNGGDNGGGGRGGGGNRTVFTSHLDDRDSGVGEGSLGSLLEPGYSERMKHLIGKASRLEIQNIYTTFKRASTVNGKKDGGSISEKQQHQYYLILYNIEEYGRLSSRLKLWGGIPRGHHRYVTYVPYKGAIILLADRRFCPLLSSSDRELPGKGLTAVVAEVPGENCDDACAKFNSTSNSKSNWRERVNSQEEDQNQLDMYKCSTRDFWFINTCSELKRHFVCEGGCNVDLNLYVPAYVINQGDDDGNGSTGAEHGRGTCLITHKTSRCNAKAGDGIQRLCPCTAVVRDDSGIVVIGKGGVGSGGDGGLTTEERLDKISEKIRRASSRGKEGGEMT